MSAITSLPDVMVEHLVRMALREDLGRAGDITTDATISANTKWKAQLVVRQKGVIAGLDLARLAFQLIDPSLRFKAVLGDGDAVASKTLIATIEGSARGIITAERVALNFLSHLSGIATATQQLVKAVKPYKANICCTRKTTPGLRMVEKYAVKAGGGSNHRFGLDDAVLIKDNHIAAVGGIAEAIKRARAKVGHLVKIELEVDDLKQLEEVMELCAHSATKIDAVLLDNMSPSILTKAVKMVNGHIITEASGRVTLDTVNAIAASGVDLISVGWITHSAPILDIGLDAA